MDKLHDRITKAFHKHVQKGWYPDIVEDWTLPPITVVSRRAAVLCCIREGEDDELYVLLTIRSDNVSTHIGDACFPGGMEDEQDSSLYETALREAEEEVNLKHHQVQFVGFLPPGIVGLKEKKLCYTAIVTLTVNIDQLELTPNNEVKEIFWMPLRLFLGPGPHHKQVIGHVMERIITYNLFQYKNGLVVYGFTARLCIMIAVIVYGEPPHFPFSPYFAEPFGTPGTAILKVLRIPDSKNREIHLLHAKL